VSSTADTCTLHGDAFIDPTPGAPDLHHFLDPATGQVIDAGSQMTSFLCQQCTTCT
jgi:thiamine biosynthesis lipoprotein ApbE